MFTAEQWELIKKFFRGIPIQNYEKRYIEGVFCFGPVRAPTILELASGEIGIRIIFSPGCPHEHPEAFILNEDLWFLPHTRLDSGQICPPDDFQWQRDNTLEAYLQYLKDWFCNAAQNNLEVKGDFYELPHFPLSAGHKSSSFIFVEENPSFWVAKKKPEFGRFLYATHEGVIKLEALLSTSEHIEPDRKCGLYIWLPTEPTVKLRRPPIFIRELNELLLSHSLSIESFLSEVNKLRRGIRSIYALVGFPVPEKVGAQWSDVHWQAFYIDVSDVYTIARHKRKRIKKMTPSLKAEVIQQSRIEFITKIGDNRIEYIKAENCSSRYLFKRAGKDLPPNDCAIFGCGSLGGHLAVLLAKSGCSRMRMLDCENVETGNICRHVLNFSSVNKPKIFELVELLLRSNPWGEFTPYNKSVFELKHNEFLKQELLKSPLWIDAGLPVIASEFLSTLANENKKRFVSIYITHKAKFLIVAISGKDSSPSVVDLERRMSEILKENMGDGRYKECFDLLTKSNKQLDIRPNIGCYFLTFEASDAKMSAAAAVVYNILVDFNKKKYNHGYLRVYIYNEDHFVYNLLFDEAV